MPRGRPASQVEVETALLEEVDHLEALTNGGESPKGPSDILKGYDDVCTEAAEAEADWKIDFATQMVTFANGASKERRDLQEARATAIHKDKLRARLLKAAVKDAHKEALVTSRTRIDALRTIAANVRAQT